MLLRVGGPAPVANIIWSAGPDFVALGGNLPGLFALHKSSLPSPFPCAWHYGFRFTGFG